MSQVKFTGGKGRKGGGGFRCEVRQTLAYRTPPARKKKKGSFRSPVVKEEKSEKVLGGGEGETEGTRSGQKGRRNLFWREKEKSKLPPKPQKERKKFGV